MKKNDEIKRQVILLSIIVFVLIMISILSNFYEKNNDETVVKGEINKTNNSIQQDSTEEKKEVSINGITEEQLQNMKGLIEQDTYEIYEEYFENNGQKSIEQIEVEKAQDILQNSDSNSLNNSGVDYISDEDQAELEHDLQEALEKYGYQVEINEN